ncbi:MAG: GspE/PulE family protein [Desulfobacterales bacterium]|nr:GspE/PulE family protein [Desulfobacterales bacterium]
MNTDPGNQFTAENVCRVLLDNDLITVEQAGAILAKKEGFKKELEKLTAKKSKGGFSSGRIATPVTGVDLVAALNLKRKDKESGLVDEDLIYEILAGEWKIPFKKIDPLKLDLNLVTTTIPRSFALRHLVLPIAIKDGFLTVATANPYNHDVFEDIARAIQLKVRAVLSPKSDIVRLIDEFFGFKRSIAAAENQFAGPTVDLGNLEQYVRLKSAEDLPSNDQHIVRAVNHLFSYAFDQRASDIHIEPKREASWIRMRIDGILHTVYKLPKNVHLAVVSRIKNLSRLNMAEKRRPQDGRIKTDKGGAEVEIRVSTVPVAFGEKIVMRVMDPEILFQDLEMLGFSGADLIRFNKFINMPHGIVLVCGPTGSGKSTTLYSTLRSLSTPEINIATVEDPIEMVHEDFNQIAVQPVLGITFATILRNILRQDPDIIMVGEMRDLETAQNAVQAALTGHLVLSTLHTNDAPSALTRLLDLGIPSFLIQATLVGILAQRLVRKICSYCKEPFYMDSAELKSMGLDMGQNGQVKLYRGKGCLRCRGTGYLGRSGIFEVLPYSETIKQMTSPATPMEDIRAQAQKEGMVTLRRNAVRTLLEGKTTYQEVLRVTWGQLD